jgi:hypothetical protein
MCGRVTLTGVFRDIGFTLSHPHPQPGTRGALTTLRGARHTAQVCRILHSACGFVGPLPTVPFSHPLSLFDILPPQWSRGGVLAYAVFPPLSRT